MSLAFHEGCDFLTNSPHGPHLTRYDAVAILEELILISPFAVKQFELLYRFASERKDKPFSRKDAVKFSKKLAKHVIFQKFKNSKKIAKPD